MRRPRVEYLVVDLETVPDDAWVAPEEGAFPPIWAHRVIAIGFAALDETYRLVELGVIAGATERELLAGFAAKVAARRPTLVTYNGRAFDLPVIALRSLAWGVAQPWYYREVRSRYSEAGHLDLCDWLADHGAVRAGRLDAIARLIGLPGKAGIDGSQVGGLYQAGALDAIERYCLGDVAQTALLLLRFRLVQGRLGLDAYRARVEALVAALAADGRVDDVVAGIDRPRLLAEA